MFKKPSFEGFFIFYNVKFAAEFFFQKNANNGHQFYL